MFCLEAQWILAGILVLLWLQPRRHLLGFSQLGRTTCVAHQRHRGTGEEPSRDPARTPSHEAGLGVFLALPDADSLAPKGTTSDSETVFQSPPGQDTLPRVTSYVLGPFWRRLGTSQGLVETS